MAPREFDDIVIAICRSLRLEYHSTPGVLMVMRPDLETILNHLPDGSLIYGFDTFSLMGYEVQARLDGKDFRTGLTVSETIAEIQGWPNEPHLWIEIVGRVPAEA